MDNKLQIITNNYNSIINTFLKESHYSKLYIETQDTQFRKLIDSFAALQAYQKYDYDNNINNMLFSVLYNAFDLKFIHTDIIKTNIECSKNTLIATNEIFENSSLYTNKLNTYCINGSILNVETIENNRTYFMCITLNLNDSNCSGITFLANPMIINNIFSNDVKTLAYIDKNAYECELNISNIYEYCFYNEYGNIFTINKLNINNKNNVIINIPLTQYMKTSINDLQYNVLFLENKFIHSIMIKTEANTYKYALNLPLNYELLQIIDIKNDISILSPAKDDINGWYLTYENNKWFINITSLSSDNYYINMICYNKIIYTMNLKPLQYKPISIKYTYIIDHMNLMYKNYITKLIMLMNTFTNNNCKGIFELIKLYDNYANLIYSLNTKYILTNKYVNDMCVTIAGLCLEITCNNKNVAFKWAINNALTLYKDIVKIVWK